MVEDYRDHCRQQPAKRNPQRTIKGATVNRELECLKCVFDLAVKRKYIPENPAAAVKHFNELRERPVRRMLTVDEEIRIVESAPPYLRVAIVLLSQTGGRTYSEGLSLRWDQVVQRAMRHTSPKTKRIYQLGMTVQVREAVEKSNERAYGEKRVLRFYDVSPRFEGGGNSSRL